MHLHNMHKFHKMHHHRGPPRFTETEDDALLSAVKQFPALYDVRHEDYKNSKVKTDIWDNIGLLLGRDVEICKRRWKDIKDNYFKIKRKHKIGNCKWPLVGKLVFLDTTGAEKRMGHYRFEKEKFHHRSPETSPLTDADNDENAVRESAYIPSFTRVQEDGAQGSSKQHEPKKQQCTTQLEDDVDLFMQSIAIQVKKLSPQLIARAKLNILTAVHDLQFESRSPVENVTDQVEELMPESIPENVINT